MHSYDAFHTRHVGPGVNGIIGIHRFNICLVLLWCENTISAQRLCNPRPWNVQPCLHVQDFSRGSELDLQPVKGASLGPNVKMPVHLGQKAGSRPLHPWIYPCCDRYNTRFNMHACYVQCMHRRIQDFVRGGQGPLGPRGGGGKALLARASLFGGAIFCGEGGGGGGARPPWPPPDPRMV